MITRAVFDHAAHAAPRMADLLAIYRDRLGGEPLYGGDNPRVGYRGLVLGFAAAARSSRCPARRFLDSFFARQPLGACTT